MLKNTKRLPELVVFFSVSLPTIKKRLYHKDKIEKEWKEDMGVWETKWNTYLANKNSLWEVKREKAKV